VRFSGNIVGKEKSKSGELVVVEELMVADNGKVCQYSMTAAYILLILLIDDVGEQNAQQHCAVWTTDNLPIVLACSCGKLKCE